MEPTTVMIGTVVAYLAKKLEEKKSIQDFFSDFTDATIKWIRPLFLKDENTYEKLLEDLLRNPESKSKIGQVEMAIASHIEDNPDDLVFLEEMYTKVTEVKGSNLVVENLKAKDNIEMEVEQQNSYAKLKDMISTEGKVTIKFKQK